jgi:hypothetical protein
MAKARSLVGLDVHASKIVAAVLDADTGEVQFFETSARFRRRLGCALAGHGDVRQTRNRYGHVLPGGEEAAAARLDAYLEPPDPKLDLAPEPPTTADDRSQIQPRQDADPDRTGDPTVAHAVAHPPPKNAKSPVNTGDSKYRYRDSNPTAHRCDQWAQRSVWWRWLGDLIGIR